MQAGTQGGEEEARLQLTGVLEYMSGAVAQEASDPNLGHHLLMPLQLRILPFVQVHLSHFLTSCKDQVQQPSIYMLSLMLLVVQLSHFLWTWMDQVQQPSICMLSVMLHVVMTGTRRIHLFAF